jgi:hypothetical protein
MTNRVFLLAWDIEGLETILDLTDLEYNIMWTELQSTDGTNASRENLSKILHKLRDRALRNKRIGYEIYIIHATDTSEQQIWDMFIRDFPGSATTAREEGILVYSDEGSLKNLQIH